MPHVPADERVHLLPVDPDHRLHQLPHPGLPQLRGGDGAEHVVPHQRGGAVVRRADVAGHRLDVLEEEVAAWKGN